MKYRDKIGISSMMFVLPVIAYVIDASTKLNETWLFWVGFAIATAGGLWLVDSTGKLLDIVEPQKKKQKTYTVS